MLLMHIHTVASYLSRVENQWVAPVDTFDPLNNSDVTHILPTCDPHVEVYFLKVMEHDMKVF